MEEDKEIPMEPDVSVALEDELSEKEKFVISPLVDEVKERFWRAERARRSEEERWAKAYLNYRGLYGKDVKFTETEKSRVFVKITKVKVLAAYGQLVDVLFASNKLPISIEPTRLPEGIEEEVHVDPQDMMAQAEDGEESPLGIGYPGDGNDLKPGETLMDRIGAKLASVLEKAKVKTGRSPDPKAVEFEPAKLAAKTMEKRIHDQLEESKASVHIRRALFEMVLLGTGVLKGPFSYDKEYPRWDDITGEYAPLIKTQPRVEQVCLWNFYPDPEATSMDDADYAIQLHKLTRSQLRDLRNRPHFRKSAIQDAVKMGPNYERKQWEGDIDDSDVTENTERYEVLEYWGNMDVEFLEEHGIEIPEELEDSDELQVNAWVCGDNLLRVVLNPFTPSRIPYCAMPFEQNPYNFFGVGLAENMEDSQTLMNGFTRMAVDNAVLAGSMMLEVDETFLVPGQDMSVYPGKIWRRQGGAPGQAIFATKWNSTANENMMMYDKFRAFADETSGVPSIVHGQAGVQGGPGRTAAGMSMFMGAAAMSVRTVVRNVDDFLLRPMGEAMFAWNMQFNHDPEIKGDLEVKARGTSALMQREVKSQRLIQFMQVGANPITAPFINFQQIIRDLAEALELDPDKLVNDPMQAKVMAELMGLTGAVGQEGAGAGAPQQGGAMDQTGGGGSNIGVGAAPMPGDQQFTGNGLGGSPNAGMGQGGMSTPAPQQEAM